jgi:adenosylcobinamide amidohydrolase
VAERLLCTISSSLWGGGVGRADYFVNWQVPSDYRCDQPVEMMGEQIARWGYPVKSTIGMQTAAKLTHASVIEETGDQFRAVCCTTAGTGNAARAGRERRTYAAYRCGTINTFILIDGQLTPAAMVNGIITAVEAKAAALQDLNISVGNSGEIATGTTTDAIVLAASQSGDYDGVHQFAGTATTLGDTIGRLVYQTVYEAVITQKEN